MSIKKEIQLILVKILGEKVPIEVSASDRSGFGHYSTNIAMQLAQAEKKNSGEIADSLILKIKEKAPQGFFERIEKAGPGFINFWISRETARRALRRAARDRRPGENRMLSGKTVMVEFTDPNPFKLFHIGHLMSNTIGESLARLYEVSGAKVIRANYQGDIGLHVAKTVWAMRVNAQMDSGTSLGEKVAYLGKMYAEGARAYESDERAKKEISGINEQIYEMSSPEISEFYAWGKETSLEYFETIYARLGTKFDRYFFESEVEKEGKELVLSRKDIFEKSGSAVVFPGEKYGLHTRVFINSAGLPTYEAKELGLNKKKFELYPLNFSIIVTGNEIIDYFRVLLKVMELMMPEVAKKTRHVPHGMLRLATGKMSSRTGEVITAESLLADLKDRLKSHPHEHSDLNPAEREAADEALAVGAIKYSILKQNPGQDIVFDPEKSLSIHGDSAPYAAYTYARLRSILRKAPPQPFFQKLFGGVADAGIFEGETEFELMRKIDQFGDEIERSAAQMSSNNIVKYLFEFANLANRYYESTPILKDGNAARRGARLMLIGVAAEILKSGLHVLGILALEKI